MYDKSNRNASDKADTIQDIAMKLVEQIHSQPQELGTKEHTVFILGSRGVGKSTVISKFFDREENIHPTLALEYSYGRRISGSQKQVLNMWELGSLDNAQQLVSVPMYTHGLQRFTVIIMLDLSQPQRLWAELSRIYKALRETSDRMLTASQQSAMREFLVERTKRDSADMSTLELMPFPVIMVGGKYDLYMNFDPEIKKQVCRCLRSMAHLIGGSLLFYSSKIPKLAKTLRDTISHLGFGSPTNPFRVHTTDYNEALSIWFGTDSWERIGTAGALSVEHIGHMFALEIPQLKTITVDVESPLSDPAKDPGFRESIIDEMRALKDEELKTIIKESQLRGQFETIV